MILEVFYDLVCPFCLIGKVRLDAVIGRMAVPPTLRWTPLLLDAGLPPEGYGFQEHHSRKYGARARPMQVQVENLGREFGLNFDFLALQRYPSSINGHRAIRYANQHGLATEMVDALLRAYFLDDRDIGDSTVLATIATELGLDGAALRERLASDAGYDAVLAECRRSVQRGARTVPSYLLDGEPIADTNELLRRLQTIPAPRPTGAVDARTIQR